VDGFDDNGVCLSRGLNQKHCGCCAPSKLIGTHRLVILISAPFDVVWIFGFDTNDSHIFLVQ
jgi:hypothetical protein